MLSRAVMLFATLLGGLGSGCGLLLDYDPPEQELDATFDAARPDAHRLDLGTEDVGPLDVSALDVSALDVSAFDVSAFDASSIDGGDFSDGPTPIDAMSLDVPTRPDVSASSDAPVRPDVPRLPTGTPGCISDAQCAGAVCWDFAVVSLGCFGTICSLSCGADAACIAAAREAGASSPDLARCGADFACNFVATGLGAFLCS